MSSDVFMKIAVTYSSYTLKERENFFFFYLFHFVARQVEEALRRKHDGVVWQLGV